MTRAAVILAAVASAIAGVALVAVGAWLAGCPVPVDVLLSVAVVESIGAAGVSAWSYSRHERTAGRVHNLEERLAARDALIQVATLLDDLKAADDG